MTAMTDRWQALRGGVPFASIGFLQPAYWQLGAGFVAVYVGVEWATFVYQLDGLGITLWGPAAGLSLVLLLAAGVSFAPFVFVASLLSDFAVYYGPRGVLAPLATSLVLALGLSAMALALRSRWRSPRPRLADVGALLVIVPLGAAVIALLYCSVLYATGLISPWRFVIAVRNFWIGDTLGIITILPAAAALALFFDKPLADAVSRSDIIAGIVFMAGIGLALWVIFGVRDANEYQFFYLLFLPIVWLAVRSGYATVSIGLLFAHVLLVSIATLLGYATYDFIAFQMLMLVLSATGLLLGMAVTEGRHSQERIRVQQRDLARAARHAIIGATGSAIAHEISQPLASAANYLHAARRLLRNNRHDAGPVAEALDNAETEAQRARETLERVRDYVSTGRLELTEVDVEQIATKIVTLIERDAAASGTRMQVASSPHLPTLLADRIQLEQLLLNLVSNAIDAASRSEGGRVGVRIAQWRDRIVVQVEDDGPGISADMAPRLFEPFETTKPKGMGLGLTLVRQIVDAHGGELRWENVEPRGARFVVELPIDGPPRHAL